MQLQSQPIAAIRHRAVLTRDAKMEFVPVCPNTRAILTQAADPSVSSIPIVLEIALAFSTNAGTLAPVLVHKTPNATLSIIFPCAVVLETCPAMPSSTARRFKVRSLFFFHQIVRYFFFFSIILFYGNLKYFGIFCIFNSAGHFFGLCFNEKPYFFFHFFAQIPLPLTSAILRPVARTAIVAKATLSRPFARASLDLWAFHRPVDPSVSSVPIAPEIGLATIKSASTLVLARAVLGPSALSLITILYAAVRPSTLEIHSNDVSCRHHVRTHNLEKTCHF